MVFFFAECQAVFLFVSPAAPLDVPTQNVHRPQDTIALVFVQLVLMFDVVPVWVQVARMITNNWNPGVVIFTASPAALLFCLACGAVNCASAHSTPPSRYCCGEIRFLLNVKLFFYVFSLAAPLDVPTQNVHRPQDTIALVFVSSGTYVWCGACLSSGCSYDHKQLKTWCGHFYSISSCFAILSRLRRR